MSFYYFAYGCNMLTRCLQVYAPSALRVDLGKLNNFRLDFAGYSEACRGAVATVVPLKESAVWGAIWRVDRHELERLDRHQMAVEYRALDQCVERSNGSTLLCRMHQHTQPAHDSGDPEMRWRTLPSLTYLDAIREGAKESCLPEEYVAHLFALVDNGRTTSLDTILDIYAGRKIGEQNA